MAIFGGGDEFRTYGIRVEVDNLDALSRLEMRQQSLRAAMTETTSEYERGSMFSDRYVAAMNGLQRELNAVERSLKTLKVEQDALATSSAEWSAMQQKLAEMNNQVVQSEGEVQAARARTLATGLEAVAAERERITLISSEEQAIRDLMAVQVALGQMEMRDRSQAWRDEKQAIADAAASLREYNSVQASLGDKEYQERVRKWEEETQRIRDEIQAVKDLAAVQATLGTTDYQNRLRAWEEETQRIRDEAQAIKDLAEVQAALGKMEYRSRVDTINEETRAARDQTAALNNQDEVFRSLTRAKQSYDNAQREGEDRTRRGTEAFASQWEQARRLRETTEALKTTKDHLSSADDVLAASLARAGANLDFVNEKATAATRTTAQGGQGFRSLGYQVYFAAQAVEDLQYGFAAVLNNIPLMVLSLGGTAGLAGTISIVGVGINTLIKNWTTLGEAMGNRSQWDTPLEKLEEMKKRLDELTKSPWRVEADFDAIRQARDEIEQLEEKLRQYDSSRPSARQRWLGSRAKEAVDDTIGSESLGTIVGADPAIRGRVYSPQSAAAEKALRDQIRAAEGVLPGLPGEQQVELRSTIDDLGKQLNDLLIRQQEGMEKAIREEVGSFLKGDIPAIARMRGRVQSEPETFDPEFRQRVLGLPYDPGMARDLFRQEQQAPRDRRDAERQAEESRRIQQANREGEQREQQQYQREQQRQREDAQQRMAEGKGAAEVLATGDVTIPAVRDDLRRQAARERGRATAAGERVAGQQQAAANRDRTRAAAQAATKETREAHAEEAEGVRRGRPYMPVARREYGAQAQAAVGANIGEERFGQQIGEGLRNQLRGQADIPPNLVDEVAQSIIHNLYTETLTRMVGNMAQGIAGGGGAGMAPGGPRSPVAASAPGQAVVARGSGSGPATVTVGGSLPGTVGSGMMGGMGGMGGSGFSQSPIMAGMPSFGGFGGGSHHTGMGMGGFGGGFGGFGGGFGGQHHRMGMMGAMMGMPTTPGVAHPFGAFEAPGMPMMAAPDMAQAPGIFGPGDMGGGGFDPMTASFLAGLGGPMVPGRAQVSRAGRSAGGIGAGLLGGIMGGVVPQRRGRRGGTGGGTVGALAAGRGRQKKAKTLAVGARASAKGGRQFGEGGLFSNRGAGTFARGGSVGSAGAAIEALARTQDATVSVTSAVADMLRRIEANANKNGTTVGRIHSMLQSMAQSQPTRQDEG